MNGARLTGDQPSEQSRPNDTDENRGPAGKPMMQATPTCTLFQTLP